MADESVEQRRSNNVPQAVAAAAASAAAGGAVLAMRSSMRRGKGESLSWSRIPVHGPDALVPPPRSGAASVVVKGNLYVFGGYGGGTGRLDDFWSYSFRKGVWENVEVLSERKPDCRENNGVVISDANRSIYLFGGYNGDCWLNDLWKYDIETKRWTCIQDSSGPAPGGDSMTDEVVVGLHGKVPTRRFGYVSVVHNGKFILFGGFDGTFWLNDMYVFDFATATWTEIQTTGVIPSVRSCPAWAKDETHAYIQGGYDGVERKSDFFALDLETYTWTEMPCLGTPPSPRYFHSCCLHGDRMYLYGGYSGSERLADMYAYDFDTNHWSKIDCTFGDVPSGRSSLVAQVHDNSIYVFGGYNGSTVLNDFFRFSLKSVVVPSARIANDFLKLINNPELSDVCFSVEGRHVYANKAILAIRSEYFRVMLCGGMRESMMIDSHDGTSSTAADDDEHYDEIATSRFGKPIDLPDVSYSVFLKVLEFLYTDHLSKDTPPDVGIHLLIASEHFMLDRLKALCEDLLRWDITTETVVSILVASHRFNAAGLKELAFDYILQNLNNSVVMVCLSDLKAEPDLLLEIIRRSNLSNAAAAHVSPSNQHHNAPGGLAGPFGGSNADWNARR